MIGLRGIYRTRLADRGIPLSKSHSSVYTRYKSIFIFYFFIYSAVEPCESTAEPESFKSKEFNKLIPRFHSLPTLFPNHS